MKGEILGFLISEIGTSAIYLENKEMRQYLCHVFIGAISSLPGALSQDMYEFPSSTYLCYGLVEACKLGSSQYFSDNGYDAVDMGGCRYVKVFANMA